MAAATKKTTSGTQAIDRALAVLSSFVQDPVQGISEIAERCALSPSTVHRIVRACVDAGYLVQSPDTDRYHFGPSSLLLGQAARDAGGFSLVGPLLEQLGGETGESVNMGVRDGDEVVVVLRVESVQPLRFDQPIGSRLALHGSSMGKTLLAFAGEEPRARLPLSALTPNTISNRTELLVELERVREQGVAFDHEESLAGVSCVAAPVLGPDGTAVAAVAVQGPTVRMTTQRLEHLARRLTSASAEIGSLLNPTVKAR